ncbi:MAG: hypothetical protein ACI4FZ_03840 [Lachnospiraceae bacterium]
MEYTGYELLWLFFLYSFLGWILETVFAAVKQKHFANRGLINGPFCIIYGIAGTAMSIVLNGLPLFWMFVGGALLATVIEWTAGHLIERLYHERWWDYSGLKWNLDGYISLPVSLLWGLLGVVVLKWGSSFFLVLFHACPLLLVKIALWVILAIMLLDIMATMVLLSGRSKNAERWAAVDGSLDRVSNRLGRWIFGHVDRRIHKAYPTAKPKEAAEKHPEIFAYGCSFYKIVLLFFIGAFLGDITETIFCRITAGVWMSRSSVVWGPFSIVWGLAIAAVTALLYNYRNRSDGFLFWTGTFLGGAYEYICSVFTEMVFGTVFWDYSDIPFNLAGRINLLYCFFWGIAAVVWFKKLYPKISVLIEKIPRVFGKVMTWILIVFMVVNILVSCMAMLRYDERSRGIPAESGWQQTMDERFDDVRMKRIYPNAIKVEEE